MHVPKNLTTSALSLSHNLPLCIKPIPQFTTLHKAYLTICHSALSLSHNLPPLHKAYLTICHSAWSLSHNLPLCMKHIPQSATLHKAYPTICHFWVKPIPQSAIPVHKAYSTIGHFCVKPIPQFATSTLSLSHTLSPLHKAYPTISRICIKPIPQTPTFFKAYPTICHFCISLSHNLPPVYKEALYCALNRTVVTVVWSQSYHSHCYASPISLVPRFFPSLFQSRIFPLFCKNFPQEEFPPRIIAPGGRSAHKKHPGYGTAVPPLRKG